MPLRHQIKVDMRSLLLSLLYCPHDARGRHKKLSDGKHYQKLSWHITLMALAPYETWRNAMQYIEKKVRPLRPTRQHMTVLGQVFPPQCKDDGLFRVAALSDGHITNNSKVCLPFASVGQRLKKRRGPRGNSFRLFTAKRWRQASPLLGSALHWRASLMRKERPWI